MLVRHVQPSGVWRGLQELLDHSLVVSPDDEEPRPLDENVYVAVQRPLEVLDTPEVLLDLHHLLVRARKRQ